MTGNHNINKFDFYMKNDEYFNKPKYSSLVFIEKIIHKKEDSLIFLDVGCANGAFLSYIQKKIPKWNFIGIDINGDLINDAINRKINAKFFVDDFMNLSETIEKADIIHAAGFINEFKNPTEFIDSLVGIANNNASIFIHGIFNKYNIDAIVNFKDYSKNNIGVDDKFGEFFSYFSIKYIKNILDNNSMVKSYMFHRIKFPEDTKKEGDPDDLQRSWTIKCDGEVEFQSGLNIIQHQYWLEIVLN